MGLQRYQLLAALCHELAMPCELDMLKMHTSNSWNFGKDYDHGRLGTNQSIYVTFTTCNASESTNSWIQKFFQLIHSTRVVQCWLCICPSGSSIWEAISVRIRLFSSSSNVLKTRGSSGELSWRCSLYWNLAGPNPQAPKPWEQMLLMHRLADGSFKKVRKRNE